MIKFSCVLLVLLISLNFFESKLADVIIEKETNSTLLVLGDNGEKQQLDSQNIPNLLNHLSGLEPVTLSDRSVFPPNNFWSNPKANIIFTVNGDFQENSISKPSQLFNVKNEVGQDIYTTLSSYLKPTANSFSSATSGKALTVSISGSKKLSESASISTEYNANSYVYYYQSLKKKFVSEEQKELLKVDTTFKSLPGMTFENNNFIIDGVKFDIADDTVYEFFTELIFINNFIDAFSEGELNKLVLDNTPDFYAFTISSLPKLKNSQTTARKFVDSFILSQNDKLQNLYNSQAKTEILYLNVASPSDVAKVLEVAGDSLLAQKDFFTQYPLVNLKEQTSFTKKNKICEELQNQIADSNVVCFPKPKYVGSMNFLLGANNTNPSTVYTNEEIASYQISLWFVVTMVIAILGFAYFMCGVGFNVTKDSLLYTQERAHFQKYE